VKIIVARWRDWLGEGLEHLVLREVDGFIRVDSFVIGRADGERFAAHYDIWCDDEWRTRGLTVRLIGEGGRLEASSDGAGDWQDGAGQSIPSLNSAIDVDISATPFTNTLPIRRLGLEAEQSEEIQVAYVDVPSLTLTAERQRYTCLEPMRRYRFESLDGNFVREIEVDEHGLVVLYPGLFKRVL